ncbi:MAG: hypothetical protein ACFFE8_13440 [Candidatus Heimdallarchaeota archaeon]
MDNRTKSVRSVSGEVLSFKITNGRDEIFADARFCPLSGTKGIRLRRITMTNHVHPIYWSHLTEKGFYFCKERDCPIVYFNNVTKVYFSQQELRVAVMHKMAIRSEGRPMCYCTGVLEEQILYELLITKCCDSLQDIQDFTGANQGKDCKITNPSGRCCGSWIKEVIEWAKAERLNIAPDLIDEARAYSSAIIENENKGE